MKMYFLDFSDYQDTDAKEKINDFSIEYSSAGAEFVIEMLMVEIQLVVAEQKRLNCEPNQNYCHFLDIFGYHESDAWIKTKGLSIEPFSARRKFALDTLVGEIIPVVTEKYSSSNKQNNQ